MLLPLRPLRRPTSRITIQHHGCRRRLRGPFVFPFDWDVFEARHLVAKSELGLAGWGLEGPVDAVHV